MRIIKVLRNMDLREVCNEFILRVTTAIRLRKITHGKNCKVFGKIRTEHSQKIEIGENVSLNYGVYLNGMNGIRIGDNCTLSANAAVISTGIDYKKWLSNGIKVHQNRGGVFISSNVWIGAGAMILPGVQITGEYVTVAAGAVVTKDVSESRCIVAGIPAKIIKHI